MVVTGCPLVDIGNLPAAGMGLGRAFRCRVAFDRVAVGSRGACWECLLRGEVQWRGGRQEAAGGDEMDHCQGGEMVGSSWMEDKPGLPRWEAILLTVGGQSPSLPGDEHCLVVGAGGVLLAGSGVLLVRNVLVAGAADVQSGTPGWVGEACDSAVGKTLSLHLLFGTGS